MQIHARKTPKLFKFMAMELHYEHYFLYMFIINNVYKNKTSKITCIRLPYILQYRGATPHFVFIGSSISIFYEKCK